MQVFTTKCPYVSQPQPWACDQGKGLQGRGLKLGPRVAFHALRSAKKCEGKNPRIPK